MPDRQCARPSHLRLLALIERDPRRSVRLAQRAVGDLERESHDRAPARFALGCALLAWERLDEAAIDLEAARQLFEAAEDISGVLACQLALLQVKLVQRASPHLLTPLTVLAERAEQEELLVLAARARLLQVTLLAQLGWVERAEQAWEGIAPVLAVGAPHDHIRLLLVQASAAIQRNHYIEAEQRITEAEAACVALHNRIEQARCWYHRAWIMVCQERHVDALAEYLRTEQVFIRFDLPVRQAFCLKAISVVHSRLGVNDAALHALLRALQLFTSLNHISQIAACQLNLGNVYFASGQWNAALGYYTRAEQLFVEANSIGEQVVARRNRAMTYRAMQRLTDAHLLLIDLERQQAPRGDQAELGEIWAELAGVLADSGAISEADGLYARAEAQFERLEHAVDAAECRVERGWLAVRRADWAAARQAFGTAAPTLAASPYYAWRVEYGLARCAEERDPTEALGHYRAAHAVIGGLRLNLASEIASSSTFRLATELHADSLRYAAAHGTAEDVLRFSEAQRALVLQRLLATHPIPIPRGRQTALEHHQRHLAELQASQASASHQDELDAALAAYGQAHLEARHSEPLPAIDPVEISLDLDQLRQTLTAAHGEAWTALVYVLDDATLRIVAVSPAALTLDEQPVDAVLRALLDRACAPHYRRYTYRDLPHVQVQAAPWAALEALSMILLPAAVRQTLHPAHRLLIVPTGPLHMLPWAALRVEGRWLVERAVIQLLPSLTFGQRPAPATSPTHEALVVGCQAFGKRARPLEAVHDEVAAIAARWPGPCQALLDTEATREALLQMGWAGELRRYALLHIASHARLFPARGLLGHIKLWDGDLLLTEVAGLQLDGACVVLSTCEGAAADVLAGEEVLSLTWAALAARAGSVIASLWQVHDQTSVAFVCAFYDALREWRDPALALAMAQREWLCHTTNSAEGWCDPYFWSSFVMTGKSRKLW